MKKIGFIGLLIITSISYSCNDDNKNEVVDKNIDVSVFFLKENSFTENPDIGSNIYIYYRYDSMDFFGSIYKGDGKFIKNDKEYIPDQSDVVNNNGMNTIQPKYLEEMFTVVVVSNYYKDRIAMHTYSGKEYPINCKIINNP